SEAPIARWAAGTSPASCRIMTGSPSANRDRDARTNRHLESHPPAVTEKPRAGHMSCEIGLRNSIPRRHPTLRAAPRMTPSQPHRPAPLSISSRLLAGFALRQRLALLGG